jgi:hypothetical protein
MFPNTSKLYYGVIKVDNELEEFDNYVTLTELLTVQSKAHQATHYLTTFHRTYFKGISTNIKPRVYVLHANVKILKLSQRSTACRQGRFLHSNY